MHDTCNTAVETHADRAQQLAMVSPPEFLDAEKSGRDGIDPRTTHHVEITPTRLGSRGQRYSVTYRVATLVENTRTPAFAACRALLARGITGRLEVWRRGKTCADMQLDIETGAGLTISETDTHGLQVVPWRQFARDPAERAAFVRHPSAGGDLASAPRFTSQTQSTVLGPTL